MALGVFQVTHHYSTFHHYKMIPTNCISYQFQVCLRLTSWLSLSSDQLVLFPIYCICVLCLSSQQRLSWVRIKFYSPLKPLHFTWELAQEKGCFNNVCTRGELMNSMYHIEVNRSLLNSSSFSTFVSKCSPCMDKSGTNMSIS